MIWLLTGIPALAVFLFVPSGSRLMHIAGPAIFLLELSYVKPISDALIKLKQNSGTPLPISGRVKLVPWASGALLYIPIFNVDLSTEAKMLLGCVAVALCSFSKVWIARRPLQLRTDVLS